jgi:hypothetical protein
LPLVVAFDNIQQGLTGHVAVKLLVDEGIDLV